MADDLFADVPEATDDLFADIPAATPDLFKDIPKDRRAGVRRAYEYLVDLGKTRGRGPLDAFNDRAVDAMTFGAAPHVYGGMNAGVTALRNLVPGLKADFSPADIYEATRIYEAARRNQSRAKYPATSFAGDVAGALTAPGMEAVGKWVVGKAAPAAVAAGKKVGAGERVLQGLRMSGAAGVQAGVTEGALATPGREGQRAREGALTGAIAAPVMGAAAGAAGKAAPAVAQGAKKVAAPISERLGILTPQAQAAITPKGPEIRSAEKLAEVLRREGVMPEAVKDAMEAWKTTGGPTPAVIDIVRDAGASPGVLNLLQKSGAKAPQRRAAEEYAEGVVEGLQEAALTEARALPGGARTPSEIRADLAKQREALEQKIAADRQRIEADRAAATRPVPASPVEPEEGAAKFAESLRKKAEASEAVYKQAYAEAEAAAPELAFVDPAEVRPFFAKLDDALKGMDVRDHPGIKEVNSYVQKVRSRTAPGNEADWGPGDEITPDEPLTVRQLLFMRDMMNNFASRFQDKPGQAAALKIKNVIDDEMSRLVDNNLIDGDPAVVDKWKTAILGYADHQQKFGSGLAKTLTAKTPAGDWEIEPWNAANAIFGARDKGARNLNAALSDLGETLKLVDEDAAEALRYELYGRLKPEDLARLMKTTGGKELLPRDLTQTALTVQEGNRVAAVDAESALADLAEQEASQMAALKEREQPLSVGEGVLKTSSEEFAPQAETAMLADADATQSGARQSIIDFLESSDPASASRLRQLLSRRARENLGVVFSPETAQTLQGRLRNIEKRGENAQQLADAARSLSRFDSPLLENITPGQIAYQSGRAEALLQRLLAGKKLTPEEYAAALRLLTKDADEDLGGIVSRLIERYPAAKRPVGVAMGAVSAREPGDEDAMERMIDEYGR